MNQLAASHPLEKTTTSLTSGNLLQRKCACGNHTVAGGECAECRKKRLQRKATNQKEPRTVPPIVHEVLRSPGRPLDPATRAFMEPRFDHDFSRVRVHTDGRSAESAQTVNALAYTVGRDVVFGTGQYTPETHTGQSLLAHELTHVVQQEGVQASVTYPIGINSDNRLESVAINVANTIQTDQVLTGPQTQVRSLQRQPAGGGAAAPAPTSHRFSDNGVSIVVRGSCNPAVFGFANVEAATRAALNAIFNTDCIEESRRTRIQRNLTSHGLDIRCRRSANLETPGACAESTGFSIPANIFTLGSRSFASHPDSIAGCQPIESTVLHEIVHLTRGFAAESLPLSCEASCFGVGGGDPTLCRDIDVHGRRRAP